ncbi:FAD/NAD(P)-binding domain-containing protein [Streptomyces sp. NBRC 109706]|uniref:FAD/NAD(P)-binding protein n=1 Tax=Streptomyces sp. NBRC 109706 TaxID=1550035 RepID=UPI0008318923|nr:FAD/NAD(P)-binding domain-containing protein [Streptomyces sp. NBRC 109706]
MLNVCIVGTGPRGLSVLERVCANERKSPSHPAVTVHVVDPYPPGPGRVWRTDQSRLLLMNTVASQVTVYTDDSVVMDGPVEAGPSLHEWAADLAKRADAPEVRARCSEATLAEARRLGPDAYPTRAFYGDYLTDAFRAIVQGAPDHVTVVEHRTRACELTEDPGAGGAQALALADGRTLTGLDAVVLALGHVPARPTRREAALAESAAAHGLRYFAPANPADVDFSAIGPGETTLVRGLGLNFFDVLALLTEGRGGAFERVGDALRYRPSGREPHIVAGSRRGVPYHARGENQKGPYGRYMPRLLTLERIARLHERAAEGERLHFATDLWPLIAKEVESVYYGTLLAAGGRSREREAFVRRYLAARGPEAEAELLDATGIAPGDRWDWETVAHPYRGRDFADRADFRAWLLDHLAADVREARAGNVDSPLKSALDVLRDLRNEIRLAVDHGRLAGDSYRDDLQSWYTPLNAFLSIGPPASRIEELIALLRAGVVEILGPDARVSAPDPRDQLPPGAAAFTAVSAVPGPPVRATALVEARVQEPDLPRTADPLLSDLVRRGQAARHRIDGTCGTRYETAGLAVTERPYQLIDRAGRPHPRRFAYGVPTETVHWVTAAGIRPGVNSVTLGDADAIARAVLALPAHAAPSNPTPAAVPSGDGAPPTDPVEVNA